MTADSATLLSNQANTDSSVDQPLISKAPDPEGPRNILHYGSAALNSKAQDRQPIFQAFPRESAIWNR